MFSRHKCALLRPLADGFRRVAFYDIRCCMPWALRAALGSVRLCRRAPSRTWSAEPSERDGSKRRFKTIGHPRFQFDFFQMVFSAVWSDIAMVASLCAGPRTRLSPHSRQNCVRFSPLLRQLCENPPAVASSPRCRSLHCTQYRSIASTRHLEPLIVVSPQPRCTAHLNVEHRPLRKLKPGHARCINPLLYRGRQSTQPLLAQSSSVARHRKPRPAPHISRVVRHSPARFACFRLRWRAGRSRSACARGSGRARRSEQIALVPGPRTPTDSELG
ncbi:hypothetical protein C8Q79DRAFT_371595 [Trametes meyenii]|nr:hypothetical protein C8Q79DRAFT_371595 [Trametes meyenii]